MAKVWLFSRKNFYLFGLCAALLVIAYVCLAQGPVENPLSKSVAPVLLVIVYCGLVPYAILTGYGKGGQKEIKK